MAKRFTDTDKIKKQFWRDLSLEAKAFWDYITLDCDHAGIWEVDFHTAECRIYGPDRIKAGARLDVERVTGEVLAKIVPIDGGTKWYIPSFVEFQYRVRSADGLKPGNKVHASVLEILSRVGVLASSPAPGPTPKGPLGLVPQGATQAPCRGAKDKEKNKYKDKEKDTGPDSVSPEDAAFNAAKVAEVRAMLSGKFPDQGEPA
jgi:hypothetical protein